MSRYPNWTEWLNENDIVLSDPKFKIGDKVVSTTGNFRAVKDVKIPRTRTNRTQKDLGDQVENLHEPLEIVDIKPYSYFISSQAGKYDKYGYFLKDADGNEYVGFEPGLEEPEKHKTNVRNKELIFYYLAFITKSKLKDISDTKTYADFVAWEVYSTKNNSGMHVATYFDKEAAEEAKKVLEKLEKESSFEPRTIEIKPGRVHVQGRDVIEIIKRFKSDFKMEDLEDVRGYMQGDKFGIA